MLGNLAAHDGSAWREIAAPKPRALLAALLIRSGDVVSVDQLLFELWGDRPPRSAPTQVQGYVLRIRRLLGEPGARSLLTAAPGYRMVVGADDLDSVVFARTARRGQAALRAGDVEHAAELLGDALAMWCGPVLADLPASPLVSGIRRRLHELWHGAWEARVDADLALGRHTELVDEVARHVDAYPLRETPWRQLMLALDGAGRRDEALAAYDTVRRILVDHSGIEPGVALHTLYDDLRRPKPRQVPATPKLVGRAAELAVLDSLAGAVSEPVVATVAGPAGIGKTALVRHWARTAADRFPDGQLHVDLHGHASGPPATPGTVLAGFLRALDVPADEVPDDEDARGALYRSRLAGKRVLIVLDNAADAGQVRPLLPGPSACVVLVTSRDDLRGLTATHGARLLRLPALEPAAAVALLGRPGDDLDELATLCGRHPLAASALDVAASTPAEVLPAAARRVLALLGLVPGPTVTPHAVAALADLPVPAASAVLDRLVSAGMVARAGPGRFACLDLLRRATELAPPDAAPRRRLADHYLATALHAAGYVSPTMARVPGPPVDAVPLPLPDRAAAFAWLDAERANLVASVGLAPGGWRLVDALRGYLSTRLPRTEWARAVSAGLAAAVAEGTAQGQAAMHVSLGHLAWCDGRFRDARRHFRTARRWCRIAGWPEGESTALNGDARAAIGLGRPAEALPVLAAALAIDRAVAFRAGEARELHNTGLALQSLGRLDEALSHQQRALALYEELGDLRGQCMVGDSLGWVRGLTGGAGSYADHASALALGVDIGWDHAQALRTLAALHRDTAHSSVVRRHADRACALADTGGEHSVRVESHTVLGNALAGLGRLTAAERHYREALTAASASGYAGGRIDALLGLADLHLRQGAPATATERAREAVTVARTHALRVREGHALTVLAASATALGDRDDAVSFAAMALDTHRRTGHHAGAAQAELLLTELRRHAG
jgi:DNA-binding SARP family transcriptional activator